MVGGCWRRRHRGLWGCVFGWTYVWRWVVKDFYTLLLFLQGSPADGLTAKFVYTNLHPKTPSQARLGVYMTFPIETDLALSFDGIRNLLAACLDLLLHYELPQPHSSVVSKLDRSLSIPYSQQRRPSLRNSESVACGWLSDPRVSRARSQTCSIGSPQVSIDLPVDKPPIHNARQFVHRDSEEPQICLPVSAAYSAFGPYLMRWPDHRIGSSNAGLQCPSPFFRC